MQMAYLIKWGRSIERGWSDEIDRKIQLHDFHNLSIHARFSICVHQEMAETEFTNCIMKLEDSAHSAASDHEIVIETQDRQGPTSGHTSEVVIVLENIRSAFNVGSILRTADGLGVKKVLLCGFTPTPEHPKVLLTALGAEKSVEWQKFAGLVDALDTLTNMKIFAIETVKGAPSLFDVNLPKSCAFILGNEKHGLSPEAIRLTDEIIKLPMYGLKNSLNVAVCAAICSFEYNRQHAKVT